ncbi:MAG: hypothetical protein ACKVTZ_22560 [Bacteroidia bacterium]
MKNISFSARTSLILRPISFNNRCGILKTNTFLLILTGIAVVVGAICYPFILAENLFTLLAAVGLAYLSTIIAFIAANMGIENPKMFWTTLMISLMVKMFVGLISCTIMVFVYKPLALTYICCYFFGYFVFTAFEVYVLMSNLRPISKKE